MLSGASVHRVWLAVGVCDSAFPQWVAPTVGLADTSNSSQLVGRVFLGNSYRVSDAILLLNSERILCFFFECVGITLAEPEPVYSLYFP